MYVVEYVYTFPKLKQMHDSRMRMRSPTTASKY